MDPAVLPACVLSLSGWSNLFLPNAYYSLPAFLLYPINCVLYFYYSLMTGEVLLGLRDHLTHLGLLPTFFCLFLTALPPSAHALLQILQCATSFYVRYHYHLGGETVFSQCYYMQRK